MIELPAEAQKALRKLIEAATYVQGNFQAYCDAMLRCCWIPDTNLPIRIAEGLVRRIVDGPKEDIPGAAETVMLRQYDAQTVEGPILLRLQSAGCLRDRIVIVEKAVRAHCFRHYELSVPTLCAQVEGTLREGKMDQSPRRNLERILRRSLYAVVTRPLRGANLPQDEIHKIFGPDDDLSRYAPVESAQFDSVQEFVDQQFFGNFRQTDAPLNRNRILHGLDVGYATEATSLRAILLLTFVVDCVKELNQQAENDEQEGP